MTDRYHRAPGGPGEGVLRGGDGRLIAAYYRLVNRQQPETELVIGALGMAILRRRPGGKSAILHSDHGMQYTSWAFGKRLRDAGLPESMGTVGDNDNLMMESFRGTMQIELLDRKAWKTREELANAIFEWIECWHNSGEGIPASGCSASPTTRHDSGRQTPFA